MENHPHIQRDIDIIGPFFDKVYQRFLRAGNARKEVLDAALNACEAVVYNAQVETIIDFAKDEESTITRQNGRTLLDPKTIERCTALDRKGGITTGVNTRKIMAMVDNHQAFGIDEIHMRKILNQSAAELGTNVRSLLPELVPFIEGRDLQTYWSRA